ncbi:unnamed protein product [Sphagnum balticum]
MSLTLLRSFISLLATRQACFGGGKAPHDNIRTLNRVVYLDTILFVLWHLLWAIHLRLMRHRTYRSAAGIPPLRDFSTCGTFGASS